MAYLENLEDEERKKLELGGGAAPMSSGGAGAVQSQPKAPEPGFANLANYFTANKDAAQQQGSELASGLKTAATEALSSDSPGQAIDVAGQINAAQTPGGLATTIEKDDPLYTGGMAGLDAYLGTRGSEPGQFQGLKEMFGGRLGKVEARPENPFPSFKDLFPGGRNLGDKYGGADFNAWNAQQPKVNALLDWAGRRQENITPGAQVDKEALRRDLQNAIFYGQAPSSPLWAELGLTVPSYWKGEG